MARILIVGCGCRGRTLGAKLRDAGLLVRGTSRRAEALPEIEAAGIDPGVADPLVLGGLMPLVDDVSVVVWLLGSATGPADDVAALHSTRLERILEAIVDTPVRGFVYEAAGSVSPSLLKGGGRLVSEAAQRWAIPTSSLEAPPEDPGWLDRAAGSVLGLVT